MKIILHQKTFQELTTDELYELLRVRSEVFVVEQNCVYQDMDGDDKGSIHLWLTVADKIVALARVCPAGTHMKEISIGRVITTERNKGYGKQIMLHAIDAAIEHFGATLIDIEAQEYAKGFYESVGFEQSSDTFMLDDIPHIKMTWTKEAKRSSSARLLPKEHKNSPRPTKDIYFAGGCFWGTEHYFKQIEGVVITEVGFANGHTENPTYKEVYTDQTGFAETVFVRFYPDVVSLEFLLQMFFKAIDPTSLNKQGHDEGTRYRTGVYYTDLVDLPVIEKVFAEEQKNYEQPLAVEKLPLQNFYTAEEYHQDYLDKNPTGYCHLPQSLFEFARKARPKVKEKNEKP